MDALRGMMDGLAAAHGSEIRRMRAEYGAKMDGMMRAMERVANGGNAGRGTPAGSGKEGADDGSGDADDLDMRGPGPHRRSPF